MEINSIDMTIFLPQEKRDQIVKMSRSSEEVISLNMGVDSTYWEAGITSHCSSASTTPKYQAMQHQQILELSIAWNFSSEMKLSDEMKTQLNGGLQNLHNGRSIRFYPLLVLIAYDASLEGWGAFCQEHKTGWQWILSDKKYHTNILELRAAKYAILTLYPTAKKIHIKMDNIVALSFW